MLHKAVSTPVWMPERWNVWRRETLAGPISTLIRYALVLLILCLAGCLYLLQTNDLARLNEETLHLELQASQLEQQNLMLKLQLAQWNSPAYIRGEAVSRNYVKNPSVLYVDVVTTPNTTAAEKQQVDQMAQAGTAR